VDRMSRNKKWCNKKCGGLTLIELMITLVILAVTVTLVSPAMAQLIYGNRLRTEAGRLVVAINLARSEAVIRQIPVSVCPSSMARSGVARCSGEYADGWIVFTNPDRNAQVDAGSDEVVRVFEPIPGGYSLTNRAGTQVATELITYLPDGSSRRNRTLLLCPPAAGRVKPWAVVLNTVGRARAAKGEGQCPAALV
jgi:type IV fimbrial biogenesis protein FimT